MEIQLNQISGSPPRKRRDSRFRLNLERKYYFNSVQFPTYSKLSYIKIDTIDQVFKKRSALSVGNCYTVRIILPTFSSGYRWVDSKRDSSELTFWRPGNLNLARRRASITWALKRSLERTDMIGWPMFTRATVPWGFPKAPRIPVWSLKRENGV